MTALSNYAENKLVDHLLGTAAYTMPTGVYVQLHTGDPGEDCVANVSAETTRKLVAHGAAAGGVAAVSATVSWDPWAAGSETISHVSYWDAAAAGNPLAKGALAASKAMTNGDAFEYTTASSFALD